MPSLDWCLCVSVCGVCVRVYVRACVCFARACRSPLTERTFSPLIRTRWYFGRCARRGTVIKSLFRRVIVVKFCGTRRVFGIFEYHSSRRSRSVLPSRLPLRPPRCIVVVITASHHRFSSSKHHGRSGAGRGAAQTGVKAGAQKEFGRRRQVYNENRVQEKREQWTRRRRHSWSRCCYYTQ